MKIGVVSSRNFQALDSVGNTLKELAAANGWSYPSIAVGGNGGVDVHVKTWAKEENLDFFAYHPYFTLDKKAAFTPRMFFARNEQIVDNTDVLIAFGEDNDTQQAIARAEKQGKEVIVVTDLEEAGA